MTAADLTADITLRRSSAGRVGGERIALLRAIDETGSISAAAKVAGLSYKGAWDAVQALNNLFERPLVIAAPGGRQGGASQVTAAGQMLITAFEAAEAELRATLGRLEQGLGSGDGLGLNSLLWSMTMRTSARNVLKGTVDRVVPGAINAEVVLTVADGVEIVSTITMESVADLGLAPGATAMALVKSSFVVLAPGDEPVRTSARNCLAGMITRRDDGPVSSEITLELQVGKTLAATVTRESADSLDLVVGMRAQALIKASHVILAID